MALMTSSIRLSQNLSDFLRISVMSRHTLNDGKTPDPKITRKVFDVHIPELGPPPKLIGSYYRGEINWLDFKKSYEVYLQNKDIQLLLKRLIELSKRIDIVLLCVEETPDFCHRRLIAQECYRLDPSLNIIIN